jgi:hypothetical protein
MKVKNYRHSLKKLFCLFAFTAFGVVLSSKIANASLSMVLNGQDSTTLSTTSTTQGNTQDWVHSFDGSQKVGEYQADISFSGSAQYVSGSLVSPSNFTKSFSLDNGSTFSSLDSAGVNALRLNATSPNYLTLSELASLYPQSPGVTIIDDVASGGDGYIPIIVPETNKVFMQFHKAGGSNPSINCYTLEGLHCPGYPKNLDTSAGYPDNFSHAYFQHYAVYEGKIFNLATNTSTTEYGVDCWDTNTDSFCGFSTYASGDIFSEASQLEQVGSKAFFTTKGNLYCHDLVTNSPCSLPWIPVLTSVDYSSSIDGYNSNVIGDMIVFVSKQGTAIECFNVAILPAVQCSSSYPLLLPSSSVSDAHIGIRPDENGDAIGFCLYSSAIQCYDFDGNTLVTTNPWGAVSSSYESIAIGPKVYRANGAGITYCWDYSLNPVGEGAPCLEFMDSDLIPGKRDWRKNNQSGIGGIVKATGTSDYGYAKYSDSCIFGLGDARTLWSFDATTGTAPCKETASSLDVSLSNQSYCDGTPHSLNWNEIKINPEYVMPTTLTGAQVYVYDQANNLLLEGTIDPTKPLDISSINSTDHTEIHIEFIFNGVTTEQLPVLVTTDADQVQVCYKTTTNDCTSGSLGSVYATRYSESGMPLEPDNIVEQVAGQLAVTKNGSICADSPVVDPPVAPGVPNSGYSWQRRL